MSSSLLFLRSVSRSVSRVRYSVEGSAEERQEHQRVGVQSRARAQILGERQVALRLGLVVEVQVERGQAVIARKQELRLAGLLGQAERLGVVLERAGSLTAALVDLAEHDQRDGQVIELAELPVELDRGLRGLHALRLAAVRERAVGNGQVRVQARLHAEVADALGGLEAL